MANLTVKNNTYQPIGLRPQQSKVGYNGAQIVDQSGIYGQVGKATEKIKAAVLVKEEADEALRVATASNEAAKRMAELKVDIFKNRQGSNAADSQAYFEQQAKRIKDEIYANSGIKYKTGELAFKKAAEDNIVSGSVWAYKWQAEQENELKATTYEQFVQDRITDVLDGGALEANYSLAVGMAGSMFVNSPPEKREQLIRDVSDQFASVLVVNDVNNKNFDRASAMLDVFGGKISPTQKVKLGTLIANGEKTTAAYNDANTIMEQCKRPDGSIDYAKAIERVNSYGNGNLPEGQFTFNPGVSFKGAQKQTVTGVKAATGLLNGLGITDVYVTSVNDSDVHVPGSAHYEGLGVDVDCAALRDATPNQRAMMKQYLEQSMPGLKVLNEYDDERSPNATGGHFHLDFTNYKGNGGFDRERSDAIKTVINNAHQEEQRIRGLKQEGYDKELTQMVMEGNPSIAKLDAFGQKLYMDDPMLYNAFAPAITKLKSLGTVGSVGGAKVSDPATLATVYQSINNGTLSVEDLTVKYGSLLSKGDYNKALKQLTLNTSPAVKEANKEIIVRIEDMFSNKVDRTDVQNAVFSALDNMENAMNPEVRIATAAKLMEDKAKVLAKAQTYRNDREAAGDAIALATPYGLNNEVANIMTAYDNNGSIAESVSNMLSRMEVGDAVQQEAFRLVAGNGQLVNETTMNDAIAKICEQRGVPFAQHQLKTIAITPVNPWWQRDNEGEMEGDY